MSELAIPTALDVLETRLRGEVGPDQLLQPLRALQRLGLSQPDMRVLIERIRSANDVGPQDPAVEDNALLALDMVAGVGNGTLRWDPAEVARLWLPRVLTLDSVRAGVRDALAPSDLLPPREVKALPDELEERLTRQLMGSLQAFDLEPQQAEFFRVPKVGVTTRPAALLAPLDRLVYEGLATWLAEALDEALPQQVVWPRTRQAIEHATHAETPREWKSSHVVVADIESYYESVDDSLLGVVLSNWFEVTSAHTNAAEAFLTTVMGLAVGLPQGPPASDLFASAYLLPIDTKLVEEGWTWSRFADDYLVAAMSVLDGRQKLEQLERYLREFGMRLNPAKTRVLRRETYLAGRDAVPRRVLLLQQTLHAYALEELEQGEDPDEAERVLREAGVEEETLWDLFYHGTTSIEEVISDIRDRLVPPLVDAYALHLRRLTKNLRERELPEDMQGAEQDLRSCLAYLAGAGRRVESQDLDDALKWFPRLAPFVAGYLKVVADDARDLVMEFLQGWLNPPADTDWVTAWLTQVPQARPELVSEEIAASLRKVAAGNYRGLLSESAAVRALAAANKLDDWTWDAFMNNVTPAMRSEIALSRLASPDGYPPSATALGVLPPAPA